MDQLTAEFEKQRNLLWEDVSFLIRESVKPLLASEDSLQTTVNSFQKHLASFESVSGDNFEHLAATQSAIRTVQIQIQNQPLLDQLDYLENCSRPISIF